jgi:hypothetical protein
MMVVKGRDTRMKQLYQDDKIVRSAGGWAWNNAVTIANVEGVLVRRCLAPAVIGNGSELPRQIYINNAWNKDRARARASKIGTERAFRGGEFQPNPKP